MDLATLLGIIGGFGVIAASILMGGSAPIFFNVPSLIIVVGGTTAVVLTRVSLKQFLGSVKVGIGAFMYQKHLPQELITEAVELSNVARKEGILALEGRDIGHPFLKQGIDLCIDGHPPETVTAMLEREIDLNLERQDVGIKMFVAIGDAAPAMGMIGTLIGLVQMLANMDDPKQIGPAMAVALLTTLYGAILANMFALPIADKLALRSAEEQTNKSLIIDALLSIQSGQNPRIIESMLESYLPKSQRKVEDDA